MSETRQEKAQRLVDEGQVGTIFRSTYAMNAWVGGDDDRYRVILYASGLFFCACEWGRFHSYTNDLCAHALAVKLTLNKEKER